MCPFAGCRAVDVRRKYARMTPRAQAHRSVANCDCGEPCFYCKAPVLRGQHEHDHMPVPYRHGGRETVPACRRCHSLKDRTPLHRWAEAALASAVGGMDARGLGLLRFMYAYMNGEDIDLAVDRDTALGILEACTTTEARTLVALLLAKSLDLSAME